MKTPWFSLTIFAVLLSALPAAAAPDSPKLTEYREAWKGVFEGLGRAVINDLPVLQTVPDARMADLERKASALQAAVDPEAFKKAQLEARFLKDLREQSAVIQYGRDPAVVSGEDVRLQAAAVEAVAVKLVLTPENTTKAHSLYDRRVRNANAPPFISQAEAVLHTEAIQALLRSPSLPEDTKKSLANRAAKYAKALGGLVFEDAGGSYYVVGGKEGASLTPAEVARIASEKPRVNLPAGLTTRLLNVPAPVRIDRKSLRGESVTRGLRNSVYQSTLAAGTEAAATAFPGLRKQGSQPGKKTAATQETKTETGQQKPKVSPEKKDAPQLNPEGAGCRAALAAHPKIAEMCESYPNLAPVIAGLWEAIEEMFTPEGAIMNLLFMLLGVALSALSGFGLVAKLLVSLVSLGFLIWTLGPMLKAGAAAFADLMSAGSGSEKAAGAQLKIGKIAGQVLIMGLMAALGWGIGKSKMGQAAIGKLNSTATGALSGMGAGKMSALDAKIPVGMKGFLQNMVGGAPKEGASSDKSAAKTPSKKAPAPEEAPVKNSAAAGKGGFKGKKVEEMGPDDFKGISREEINKLKDVDPEVYADVSKRFEAVTEASAKQLRGDLGQIAAETGLDPSKAVSVRGKQFKSAVNKLNDPKKSRTGFSDLGDFRGGRVNTRNLQQTGQVVDAVLAKNPTATVEIVFEPAEGQALAAMLRAKYPKANIKLAEKPGYKGRVHIDLPEGPGQFRGEIQIGPEAVTKFYDSGLTKKGAQVPLDHPEAIKIDGKPATVHDNFYKELRAGCPASAHCDLVPRHDALVDRIYKSSKNGTPDDPALLGDIAKFNKEFVQALEALHGKK